MTGGPSHLLNLIEVLDQSVFEPILLTQKKSELLDICQSRGIETNIIELPSDLAKTGGAILKYSFLKKIRIISQVWIYNKNVKAYIRKQHIDIVWGRNIKSMIYIGLASKIAKKPLIWDVGMELPAKGVLKIFYIFFGIICSKVILQSENLKGSIFGNKFKKILSRKLKIIHPPVTITAKAERANTEYLRIICVASISARKNQLAILTAMKNLQSHHRKISLKLVGPIVEDYYFKSLTDYIDLYNIKNVEFITWSDNVSQLMDEADVFVLTSLNEGVPRVLREALVASMPIIATNVGGVSEAVIDNETGFLLKTDNVQELIDAIDRFIDEPELLKTMGCKARQLAVDKFAKENWGRLYNSMLKSMIAKNEKN